MGRPGLESTQRLKETCTRNKVQRKEGSPGENDTTLLTEFASLCSRPILRAVPLIPRTPWGML